MAAPVAGDHTRRNRFGGDDYKLQVQLKPLVEKLLIALCIMVVNGYLKLHLFNSNLVPDFYRLYINVINLS
uniref:SFRICE_005331 n=1 Tax=Spodoptera frugiperda TaxID=7108 RepID=A0A2H1VJU6_SPOFR